MKNIKRVAVDLIHRSNREIVACFNNKRVVALIGNKCFEGIFRATPNKDKVFIGDTLINLAYVDSIKGASCSHS